MSTPDLTDELTRSLEQALKRASGPEEIREETLPDEQRDRINANRKAMVEERARAEEYAKEYVIASDRFNQINANRKAMVEKRARAEEYANECAIASDRFTERVMTGFDTLEQYTRALEDVVARLAPDAPLLRGTWRDRQDDRFDRRQHRMWARHWRSASLALRTWDDEQREEREPDLDMTMAEAIEDAELADLNRDAAEQRWADESLKETMW